MFIASFNPYNYPIGLIVLFISSSQMWDKYVAQCYIADKCHRLDINPDLSDKKSILQLLGIFLSKLISVIMKFMIMSLKAIKVLSAGGQRVSFEIRWSMS